MSVLNNFPFKNQLNEPNIDHLPDQNADMNCLPTCLAAGMQFLNGKEYTGSEVEHAVYGPNYQGGTAAVQYVQYCLKQGVRIYAISGNPDYLVSQVHAHLALGHPVVGTIPSCYCPPADRFNPGSSHCIVFYKDSAGVLIAMNPWQAFSQANSDQWWSDRFCYGQVWIMEKVVDTSPQIPQGWKPEYDAKKELVALVAPNGKRVRMGFMLWVLAHQWHPDNVPLEDEHGAGDGTEQLFSSVLLCWNAKRGVYEAPLGPMVVQFRSSAQADEQTNNKLSASLTQALEQEKALQAEVDALKAQPKTDNSTFVKELTSIADSIQNVIDSIH